MTEDHPQKRRPRAGAFLTNHQHALQLQCLIFHQDWWTSAPIFPPGLVDLSVDFSTSFGGRHTFYQKSHFL
jgi:hypothetical protein